MKKLDIVLPVLNEDNVLKKNVMKLYEFMLNNLSYVNWKIVIVDNGSSDSTQFLGEGLSRENSKIQYIRLNKRGRGRALKKSWNISQADVVSYMDIDLSTDLMHLPELISSILYDDYVLAIGSRLIKDSNVYGRSLFREICSRGYSYVFRFMFNTKFHDAQCGFKAFNISLINEVLGLVKDNEWFFDTELLIIAEKNEYKIKEIPVKWVDDSDSRVNVLKTIYKDLKGLLRLRFGGLKQASIDLKTRSD